MLKLVVTLAVSAALVVNGKCPPKELITYAQGSILCKTSDGLKQAIDGSTGKALAPFIEGATGKGFPFCFVWIDGLCTEEKSDDEKNCGMRITYFVRSVDGKVAGNEVTDKFNEFATQLEGPRLISRDDDTGDKRVWRIRDHFSRLLKILMKHRRGGAKKGSADADLGFDEDDESKKYSDEDYSIPWLGKMVKPPRPPKKPPVEPPKEGEKIRDAVPVEILYGWKVSGWSKVNKSFACPCEWDIPTAKACLKFGEDNDDISVKEFEYSDVEILFKRKIKVRPRKYEDGKEEEGAVALLGLLPEEDNGSSRGSQHNTISLCLLFLIAIFT
eukprot:GHVR01007760.1.p1 GENE.GHVR01007760.1~~GHVR01007760.1.p1  ORF type:complete len:329 (+),score=83.46 GHVR01007760.1:28-1014(+)